MSTSGGSIIVAWELYPLDLVCFDTLSHRSVSPKMILNPFVSAGTQFFLRPYYIAKSRFLHPLKKLCTRTLSS